MRVLVACEFSGVVRRAFRALGHDAWSCDLLLAEDVPEDGFPDDVYHIRGDALDAMADDYWDLMIAHPPCTHLSVSGARWFKDKQPEQQAALEFVEALMAAPIDRIAIENPISIISSRIRKPDQIIQPWQFGHGETKATCLWLKNLPKLTPTNIVEGREARVHRMPRPVLIGGKSAAGRLKALRRPWLNNGAYPHRWRDERPPCSPQHIASKTIGRPFLQAISNKEDGA